VALVVPGNDVCNRAATRRFAAGDGTISRGPAFRASTRSAKETFMNRTHLVTNAILWGAAIVASAIVGAPPVLSGILLPALAACALVATRRAPGAAECRR
jgi:hypothetical protein